MEHFYNTYIDIKYGLNFIFISCTRKGPQIS